jgi:serine/threonine protein kinase
MVVKALAQVTNTGSLLGGRYRVGESLGLGLVFAGVDEATGERVVLKWVDPDARPFAQLRHPNLVETREVLVDGEQVVLVMQRLEGETLAASLARGGMPLDRFINALMAAMYGVAELHRCGLVHGAIQPEHIVLVRGSEPGRPLVKVVGYCAEQAPQYLAPEQLAQQRIDARADVYAFGVLLYRAITGRFPHEADDATELAALIREPAIPAQTFCAELPAGLCRVIGDALAHDREARLESLPAFLTELKPYAFARGLNDAVIEVRAPTAADAASSGPFISASPSIPPTYSRTRPRVLPWRSVAALLALAFFALLWHVHNIDRAPPPAAKDEPRDATPALHAPSAERPRGR